MLLSERVGAIVHAVTPETILSSTQALVELGFSATTAFIVLMKVLEADDDV